MKSKHLFFDLDRTLWDFETNSEIALNTLFHNLKLHESIENFSTFHDYYKHNNAKLWKLYGEGKLAKEVLRDERFRITLEQFNVLDPNIVKYISDGYVEISPQQTALFPNTIETLHDLQKEGFNMHIITNGFKEVQFTKLEKSGLNQFFDVIVCSEDVGQNKPAAAIFHHALNEAMAHTNDSVMIGDDYEVDIIGALNFGMKAVLFDPKNDQQHYIDIHRICALNELPERLPWVMRSC